MPCPSLESGGYTALKQRATENKEEMKVQPRIVMLHSIPTPYRVYQFALFDREFRSRGIQMEALFMAKTTPERAWHFESDEFQFSHRMLWGIRPVIRGIPFYLNPGAVWDLLVRPPRWLCIGGWYTPTALLVSFLIPLLRPQTRLFLWSESTVQSERKLKGGLELLVKRLVLNQYDAVAVLGQAGAENVRRIDPKKKVLQFGYVVNEHLYGERVWQLRAQEDNLRARYEIPSDMTVFFVPARLHPAKGILNFLKAIAPLKRERFLILSAGEGIQRSEIETWVKETSFRHLRLLGHQDENQLLELYALADVLLLPSISETYGAVILEALWAALPLLLSNRVGALPETLLIGLNGWTFDPFDHTQIVSLMRDALARGRDGLRKMGEVSKTIARERFVSTQCCALAIDQMLEILQ